MIICEFLLDKGIVMFWIGEMCVGGGERMCLSQLIENVCFNSSGSLAQYMVYLTSCHSEGFIVHISV